MLSTAKINLRKKTDVLLNRQSKRTRNVIKSTIDREIYQLVMHEKNSSSRHVTKMGRAADYAEGRGGGVNTLSVTYHQKLNENIPQKSFIQLSVRQFINLCQNIIIYFVHYFAEQLNMKPRIRWSAIVVMSRLFWKK